MTVNYSRFLAPSDSEDTHTGQRCARSDRLLPKRGHLSPADRTAAAEGPSTPTRAAGGASSAGETPPQPKRPRNLLPPSIADAEEQTLREASETLAANRSA